MEKEQYLNIKRPEKNCLLCGCSLVEVEKHPSILAKIEQEPTRKDFCPTCWEKIQDRDYFSYWLTKRIKPDNTRRLTKKERNNLLLRMFEFLNAQKGEGNAYMLFYISHLLMRYKVFNWKGTRPAPAEPENNIPERTLLVFENRITGEEITIQDQTLDGEKIAATKKEIDEYLLNNLPEESPEDIIE